MAKRNLFCDIETTGLKIELGAVPLAIGMLLDNGTPDDPEPKSLIVTICPTEDQWSKASSKALEVNGFTWEQLQQEGIPMEEAVSTICNWLAENDVNS